MDWGIIIMAEKAWEQEQLIAVWLKHEVAAQHMAQTRTQEERGQMWAWAVTLKACPRLIHFSPTRLHLLKVP